MKAIVWTAYGPPDVLRLREIEKPVPRENEVLIRVHASTVTAGDCELRNSRLPFMVQIPLRLYNGWRQPKRITILGQELAGVVESAGQEIKRFKPGDPVYGTTGLHFSAYAEYVCLPEGTLAHKPANLTFEQAAAVPVGGLEALYFLRQANIRAGEKVLVYGAGGSIGTFAVQLALGYGAKVTAVDRAGKLEMLRSLGAEEVIDYTRQDFTSTGKQYDVIFDVVGKSPFSKSLQSLRQDGRYLVGNAGLLKMIRGDWASRTGSKKVILGTSSQKVEDLIHFTELIEAGRITPVIDRVYPLEKTAEAHAYVESGEKKGGVVISMENSPMTIAP